MALMIESLDHLVINVSDLKRSAEWYQRVLGVVPHKRYQKVLPGEEQKALEDRTPTSFTFGRQALRLRPVSTSKQDWATADHESAGSEDLCFLTRASTDEIVEHLGRCGVAIAMGPVERQGAQSKLISVYCRDPDGSLIEIATPSP